MKKAFTMIELVFVIVVIGILAAVIIPNTRTNSLYEAATQLISHIRYTQHLAMVDDKFDSTVNSEWYMRRWQLIFGKSDTSTDGKIAYTIFSDNAGSAGHSNPDMNEMAKDPMNSDKYLSGGYSGTLSTSDSRANKKMNLGVSYSVTTVEMSGDCNGGCDEFGGNCTGDIRISFDHLGRPIKGALHGYASAYETNKLLQNQCKIILGNQSENNVTIAIEAETGYAHIL
jgi:prepilin-type N-terminal cleavage/methylation domain-containing protein